MKVEISDWVHAKTRNGELIHGFVDGLDEEQRMANVFVVKSDNDESVGKSILVREQWVRKLPTYALEDAEAIQSLIDIALSTKDDQWFEELTLKLQSVSKAEGTNKGQSLSRTSFTNRLRYKV
ncbi:hypothetical protein [Cohnella luojiensis]|jgi:hypothetical protein|uniref:IDEAL domain-containing protein n=1 Tax=Cohnella luojiensis TaxID=652876 RepID=A0A4Y8M0U4_9BACL|nr:hypothetical protein [Cohnella luojiensis]TFE28118.1 hypothetical protein E2980_07825 [Cohnella luojiensis]